jgi:hypothetical protein
MKSQNAPLLVLAIALQIVPLTRLATLNPAAAPSSFANVCKWLAGAAALLGGYDTVSGASAAIAGVANVNPAGSVTLTATGAVSKAFSYRIIVTNPGSDTRNFFWNAAPLPDGLTINTNLGGNGWITGTPTVAGSYAVKLTAGYNRNIVYKNVTIDIGAGATPPVISQPPQSRIAVAGATVTLDVTATGENLAYQWFFNGASLADATNSTLVLANATPELSGQYTAAVNNPAGSVTSDAARLLIVPAPGATNAPLFKLEKTGAAQITLTFDTAPGYRYLVEASSHFDPTNWVTLTNLAPAFTSSTLSLIQDIAADTQHFYRAKVTAE